MPDSKFRVPPTDGRNLASHPTSDIRDSASHSGLTPEDEKKPEVRDEQRVSFKIINKIGQGGYGLVYTVEKNEGIDKKAVYAMKVINKRNICRKPKEVGYIQAERHIMANLRHPFIVGLNYAFQTTKQFFYIMDFVPGGEIYNRLAIHGAFDDETTRFYATEIVCALEFLHFHSIVYRDLKPDNVLIAGDGHIKLSDFGLSKALPVAGHGHDADDDQDMDGFCTDNHDRTRSSTRSCCGTLVYMAPEVVEKTPYGKAADLWSLGAVIYDMLVGQPPFHVEVDAANFKVRKTRSRCGNTNTNRKATKYNILHCNYKFPAGISCKSQSLVNELLQLDVEHRLGGYEADFDLIRGHEFFQGIDWSLGGLRQIRPPFVPNLQSPTDVSHFDEEHTKDSKDTGVTIVASFSRPRYNAAMQEAVLPAGDGGLATAPLPYIDHFDYTSPFLFRANCGRPDVHAMAVAASEATEAAPSATSGLAVHDTI